MLEEAAYDPQAAIDKLPPPRDPRISGANRVPPENRFTYSTPNLSDNTTPDKNPVATTNYPIKTNHPRGSA